MAFQTVIFDVDSTLTPIEGIDELARLKGVEDEVISLTQQAMNGDVPLEDVFAKRLALIKPTKTDLEKVAQMYIDSVLPHTKEVVERLSVQGKRVYLVSGGYREAIVPLAQFLGIPKQNVFANKLLFDKSGNYVDFDRSIPLWREDGKKITINSLTKIGESLLIGDGVSDLVAKDVVDYFVGYGGFVQREKVRQQADTFLQTQCMLPLLQLAGSDCNL